jgi:hypothetical protein
MIIKSLVFFGKFGVPGKVEADGDKVVDL